MKLLTYKAVCDLHGLLLAQFGGGVGLRDAGALDAAIDRVPNAFAYGGEQTVAQIAAVYLHGIIKAHAFIDGNKRTAITATMVFLERNGLVICATEAEIMALAIAVAESEISQEQAAEWLGGNTKKV